jgi:hypothetical protein
MGRQQGGNFKGSKHQRSKKKTTGKKQDGGILPWVLFKAASRCTRRRRRRPVQYIPRYPQPRRQPRSMFISVNNTQFSRSQKMYNPQQKNPIYPQSLKRRCKQVCKKTQF